MVQVTLTYTGDLHCEAEHAPSGDTLVTDAPKDNRGRGAAFSPTDLVATSLGTCVATIIGIQAQDLGLDVEGMEVTVEKEMASNPRRIASLHTEVRMPRTFDADVRERLERAGRGCPVHHSLHPDIDAPISFVWPRESA